jgi:hypothetical protein
MATFLLSCNAGLKSMENTFKDFHVPESFGDYWYQGLAELTSYDLEQARYGEIRKGSAVLIFVTEDFSRSKQVKLDDPERSAEDAIKVLKLNFSKKFHTGIYPYSMMSSAFTPVYLDKDSRTLKVTSTSQEWCGHTFTQINLHKNDYVLNQYSYFEAEGDTRNSLKLALLEDEIWNLIRLAPNMLPTGVVPLITGTFYDRLSHKGIQLVEAEAALDDLRDGITTYEINFPSLDRTLTIGFRTAFPHEIEWWEETYKDVFGKNAVLMTTRAVKRERIMVDYWNRNAVADSTWREALKLP